MVYKLVLPQHVGIAPNPLRGLSLSTKKKEEIGLLQTCRQVRDECRHILYRTSIFHISLIDRLSYLAFLKWIPTVREDEVSKIQELRIYLWIRVDAKAYVDQRYDVRPIAKSPNGHSVRALWDSPASPFQGHLTKILDKLSRKQSSGPFCLADVMSMVDTLYLHSYLHNCVKVVNAVQEV